MRRSFPRVTKQCLSPWQVKTHKFMLHLGNSTVQFPKRQQSRILKCSNANNTPWLKPPEFEGAHTHTHTHTHTQRKQPFSELYSSIRLRWDEPGAWWLLNLLHCATVGHWSLTLVTNAHHWANKYAPPPPPPPPPTSVVVSTDWKIRLHNSTITKSDWRYLRGGAND